MTARRLRLLRGVSALVGVAVVVGFVELIFWMLPVREASPRLLPDGNDRILSFRPHESWRYSAGWNFWLVEDVRTNNSGWVSDIDYVREADTPLVAFVGDSYIEGDHVPWPDTCHGRLASRLAGESRIYSFAVNGSPLSQYLAYTEYSRDMYRPDILVIPDRGERLRPEPSTVPGLSPSCDLLRVRRTSRWRAAVRPPGGAPATAAERVLAAPPLDQRELQGVAIPNLQCSS